MNRRAIVLACVLLFPGSAWAASYSTTFALTENPISEAGHWVNGQAVGLDWKNVQTINGQAYGTQSNGGYDDSTAVLAGTWAADQAAQATVYVGSINDGWWPEVELRLRTTITPHSIKGYEINFSCRRSSPYVQIVRWNGPLNNFTYVAATNLPAFLRTGDTVKATITGSTIVVYLNGAQILLGTDTAYTSGTPGVGFFHTSDASANTTFGFSAFAATDSGTASPPSAPTNVQIAP